MSLLLGFNLQAVLRAPQEPVGAVKIENFASRNQLKLGQRPKRLQRARFLQESVACAMNELKSLHDKFDLTNAADAEFDVPLEILPSDNIALDASLNTCDLVEKIGRRVSWINERLMLP